MHTALKSVLAVSALLSGLQLGGAEWTTDVAQYLVGLPDDSRCKTYMLKDFNETIVYQSQEEACLTLRTSEPLFPLLTRCSPADFQHLKGVMCTGAWLATPVTADWRHRLGSHVAGLQDVTCKGSIVRLIDQRKGQTKDQACDYIDGLGTLGFLVSTRCSLLVHNDITEILCRDDPPTVRVTAPTVRVTAPTVRVTADQTAGRTKVTSGAQRRSAPKSSPAYTHKTTTGTTSEKKTTALVRTTYDKPRAAKTTTAATPATATTHAPGSTTTFSDWLTRLDDRLKDQDKACQDNLLSRITKTATPVTKEQACALIRTIEVFLHSLTGCPRQVYGRMKEVTCQAGTSRSTFKQPTNVEVDIQLHLAIRSKYD